ncbi:MAG: LAGLIDADG family homing endonuclease [Anaerolineales bacterium]
MNIMYEVTDLDKSYLAGFFDGEGCVSIRKSQGKKVKPRYDLEVILSQNQRTILHEFQQKTGLGRIYITTQIRYGAKHTWRSYTNDAKALLIMILPYLRDKRDQAELALAFIHRHNQSSRPGVGKGRGYHIPQEVWDEREKYYQILRDLKKGRK